MPPTPEQAAANYAEGFARAQAYANALHSMKFVLGGRPSSSASAYERLRERYAHGKISLGQFEAEVTVLLQSAA